MTIGTRTVRLTHCKTDGLDNSKTAIQPNTASSKDMRCHKASISDLHLFSSRCLSTDLWQVLASSPQQAVVDRLGTTYCVLSTPVCITQWRHQMETFSALLALCVGNPAVTGGFPSQRPVTRSFDVFFDLSWANNPDIGDLRRHRAHYDVTIMR